MLPTSIKLQEDELLFSGLTRLARLNGLMDTREALLRLTGGRNYGVSADLPSHLQAVVERVGLSISAVDADALLEGHTLFPYYRLFMPAQRWPFIRTIALSSEGGRLKAAMGILAYGVGATPVLRYCPACLATMRAETGSYFWHRVHQLPGVAICTLHNRLLVPILAQTQLGHRARLWLPPQPTLHAAREPTGETHDAQRGFAMISRAALHYRGEQPGAESILDAYDAAMRSNGWTYRSGRIHTGSLISALRTRWTGAPNGPLMERFRLAGDGPMPWIHDLLRRQRCHSPLAHLLLVQVLFASFDHFIEACGIRRRAPQGRLVESTFETVAKSAEDLTAAASMGVSERSDRFTRAHAMLGQSSRSCRDIAACCGVSVNWVVGRRRRAGMVIHERRKTVDARSLAAIRTLLSKGLPVSEVARRCDLSVSSVYRALSADPVLATARGQKKFAQTRQRHREQWVKAANVALTPGTQAIRVLVPACYAWLYRNDRPWLMTHEAARPLKRSAAPRVDWARRDADLAEKMARYEPDCADAMRRLMSPAGAASLVYPNSSLLKHAGKLPKFTAAARSRATPSASEPPA